MAAFDLADLRQQIRFRGDYQNVRKFPNADIDNEIQRSFAELWELIANTHEGYWDTQIGAVTVANQAFIALPADCWRVQGIDRLDGSNYRELLQVNISERNRYGSTTDKPLAYRLTARGADVYPTPNAIYTMRVVYTPQAPTLAEGVDRDWFNGWEDYVIISTLLKLDEREQKPLQERMMRLEQIKQRIVSGATKRKQQEPEYLRLREFDYTDSYGGED